ncbi:hypothetical protein TESG_08679 [Trichophyton tonsurans CBS 112818]|uniref:Uncharacterized protein n=1 Tax=Trichophyton tonsurans (strain CBS 112818) TaxID=647933 RepID=F2SBG8_TRIT1|nr:hypothetical protein TESG_08679 [Trichophyton tonsurans CBS 112818]
MLRKGRRKRVEKEQRSKPPAGRGGCRHQVVFNPPPRQKSEVEPAVKGTWRSIGGTRQKTKSIDPVHDSRQDDRLYKILVRRLDAAGRAERRRKSMFQHALRLAATGGRFHQDKTTEAAPERSANDAVKSDRFRRRRR